MWIYKINDILCYLSPGPFFSSFRSDLCTFIGFVPPSHARKLRRQVRFMRMLFIGAMYRVVITRPSVLIPRLILPKAHPACSLFI